MKKLLIILFFLLGFLYLKPAPVFAGCQMQNPSVEAFKRCQAVAPGSTFSFLYYPGTSQGILNQIVHENNKSSKPANLDVRLYVGSRLPTQAEVNEFLISLGGSESKVRVNARLNNEVNNIENEGLGGQLPKDGVGKYLFSTYNEAYKFLREEGINDNVSLGIALDHLAPNIDGRGLVSVETTVEQMRRAAGAAGVDFNQWLKTSGIVWMMNGYVFTDNPKHYKDGLAIDQVLARLGLPTDIRYAFFEAGANRPGHVSYDPNDLKIALVALVQEMARMKGTYNFEWINLLTVNPDSRGANTEFNLLDHPGLIGLLLDLKDALGVSPESAEALEKLLNKNGYIHCPNGGIAKTVEECNRVPKPIVVKDPELACTTSNAPKGVFRPFPCENCEVALPGGQLAYGRISTVEVFTDIAVPISWIKKVDACPDYLATIPRWGGKLQLITDEEIKTTVPFAGFHDSDKEADATSKYLTDYYDGTLLYNGVPYDPANKDQTDEIFRSGGVFRKLAPQALQDKIRKELILGTEDPPRSIPINDYEVILGSDKAHISDFKAVGQRIKPLRSDFPATHQGDLEYQIALNDWMALDGGKWQRLWPAIPLTSREDNPGEITMNMQGPPGTLKMDGKNGNAARVSFPHLARLDEILGQVRDLLTSRVNQVLALNPFSKSEIGMSAQKTTGSSVLAANTISGQVLAEEGESKQCNSIVNFVPQIVPNEGGGFHACYQINGGDRRGSEIHGASGCHFGYRVTITVNGQPHTLEVPSGGCLYTYDEERSQSQNNTFSCNDGGIIGQPVNFSGDATVNFNLQVTKVDGNGDTADCRGDYGANLQCKVVNGVVDPNCKAVPLPPPPIVCGNNFFYSPGKVDNDSALRDSNSNQDVVCTNPYPVTATIDVVNDQVPVSADDYAYADVHGGVVLRVSRQVGIGVLIPHLNSIWQSAVEVGQTRLPKDLGSVENADLEARSPVGFIFKPTVGSGGANPGEGFLYYPHLGGAQCAKLLEIASTTPAGNTETDQDVWQRVAGEYADQCGTMFNEL